MGLTHICVTLKNLTTNDSYQSNFFVDTGAIDSLVPASDLRRVGITPGGKRAYELADGSIQEYEFGYAEFVFMNDQTVGRVIFGPDGVEPLLGVRCWSRSESRSTLVLKVLSVYPQFI